MHTRLLNLTWAVICFCTAIALAQDVDPNIVGCSTVGCPNANTTGTCKVANETFIGIGVAPIISDNNSFPSLAWVQGSDSDNQKASTSTNTDVFYLAAPPGSVFGGTNGTQACALFFRQVNATMPGEDIGTATGTCASAMQQSCIDSLVDRARNLKAADGADACGALQQEFTDNFDDACSSYSTDDKWQGLTTTAIQSSNVIAGDQNSTSDCWPIAPKSDDLIRVSRFITSGQYPNGFQSSLFELTPILSVFYGGDHSIVSETQAQLTCLKLIGTDPGAVNNGTSSTSGSLGHAVSSTNLVVGLLSLTLGFLYLGT